MLIERTRNLFGLLVLGLLVACKTPPPGPDPDPAPGALAVTVIDLPAGLPAAVRVTGPGGYVQDLAQSQTLVNLAPGEYTVTANAVPGSGLTYLPSAGVQLAVVAPRATAHASISYTGVTFRLGIQQVATLPGAVFLASPPGDPRQFIVEREGLVHIMENGVLLSTPFLDIHERVLSHGEGGLLSMAFHPDYATNGYFYLYLSDKLHGIVVARYRVSANRNRADADSELVIIRIQKIGTTHNGGLAGFGPDGYLYMATGDDGGTGDPYRNGQNLDSLLGKVLRIDVAHSTQGERYRVPPSNPFVGQEGKRPEIWAYGLRNPWRFSFDTNLLYLADVGQAVREEVDISSVTQGGLNYGWNIMEGSICYDRPTCDRTGLTLPAFEYDHGHGCSITGGYVYRGKAIPELAGHYLYSDFCRGFLRSFVYTGSGIAAPTDWLISGAGNILSFGRDADGELYLIASKGAIYKIIRTSPSR
ncbi:PQQ-dependent sugar dehydrogenase [Massilia sp. GCM10020059]|uniref:PQQ-dependent sugar dehydrogenase n=1 Tax=Massilia agrisoli TaxID=2892444 RepID=A0ABS8IQ86_9BURK|nr:PQQ-dependent sugar dehydrogenase [Massilia agrisoli]MCC6070358.1 PQQ-dependent sugar dehydrogenase [Massilia agrisoli]